MPCAEASERARRVAARTVRSLRQQKLLPTPENYELFYAYHERRVPALVAELDRLLAEGGRLDRETCRALHARHLGRSDVMSAVETAGSRLRSLTERMDTEVGEAERTIGRAATGMAKLTQRAGSTTDAGELRGIVRDALAVTREVVAAASRLEEQLHRNRAELMSVTEAFMSAKRDAETDPLTGIANRRRFERELRAAVDGVRQGRPSPVLLLADIDHFKAFNDRWGHATGDLVLKAVAGLLSTSVQERDLVARWGGEEFAVLLAPRSLGEGAKAADRLRRLVSSRNIRQRKTGESLGCVTLSLGVGAAHETDSVESWVDRVDAALYRAKRGGRDRVEIAELPLAGTCHAEPLRRRRDGAPARASAGHRIPAAADTP